MKVSSISKYYDLRYLMHKYYISPVELHREWNGKKECDTSRPVDTVSISDEARILYRKHYLNASMVSKR